MADLERELRALSAEIEFPPEPDLVQAVRARLTAPERRRLRWRPLAVALAVIALAVGVAFAVPQARSAILRFLGLRGVKIELVDKLPAVPVTTDLALGERVSLEEAQRRVQYRIVTSNQLGEADAVYVGDRQVSFLYGTPQRARLLFTQFPGATDPGLVKKIAGPQTRVEFVAVSGEPGLWISGAPHFLYLTPDDMVVEERVRLARNTLLWERGPLTLRLEGELSREEALRIARSVR